MEKKCSIERIAEEGKGGGKCARERDNKRKNQYSDRAIISNEEFNHANWDNNTINLRENRVKSAYNHVTIKTL